MLFYIVSFNSGCWRIRTPLSILYSASWNVFRNLSFRWTPSDRMHGTRTQFFFSEHQYCQK